MSNSWLRKRSSDRISRFEWRQGNVDDRPKRTGLEQAASLATILASIVASFALAFGYHQFRATQLLARQTLALQNEALQHEREAKAIDLFLKFNEIQLSVASPSHKSTKQALYWQQNLAVTTTESIFKLMEADSGWLATVAFMLREQTDFLMLNGLDCPTYLPAFVTLVNKVMEEDVCR
jgi:hypothetical protein